MLTPANNNYGKSLRIGVESCSGPVSQSVWPDCGSYLLKMQKGERDAKRTMWFRGRNVPILYGSDRKDILGSGDWIARGTIQRIGATIFATGFFCGFDCSRCRQPQTEGRDLGSDWRRFGSGLRNIASGFRFLSRVHRHVCNLQAAPSCGSVILQMKTLVSIDHSLIGL